MARPYARQMVNGYGYEAMRRGQHERSGNSLEIPCEQLSIATLVGTIRVLNFEF